jgi:2-(3-amino-3-carboxypropyl)histidine synthase
MMGGEYDFELGRIASTIRERRCGTVLLQFPEGLKRKAGDVADVLSGKTDAIVIVSGEPCFGACDIPQADADLIVHFGHLPIPNLRTERSVLFIQARSNADPKPAIGKALPSLESPVGLLTTAQHIHLIGEMAGFIESKGLEVMAGKGSGRLFAEGQVLGCNASAARAVSAKANSYLFVGTGNFHPMAVALVTPKPVMAADPVTGEVTDIAEARDRMLRQRHAAIERARTAERFGIILSTKSGQRRMKAALSVRAMLSSVGAASVIAEFDTVTPQKLNSLGFGAWISTACPRLAMDDYAAYETPMLTVPEAEILVGKRSWDDYILDEID